MTERLYYQDPAMERFQARLLAQEPAPGGGFHVELDRTAFYPEGGGQPAARGTLHGLPVADVQLEGERILHRLEGPLDLPPGSEVSGAVDPERRLEFRQQHTGQHLVSACLEAAAGAHTVSASLGERFTTVEVDSSSLSEEALQAAEAQANRAVCRNLPVRVHWGSREQAARFALRKPPPPHIQTLRIVQIEGLDACACGGLHVDSSGEVGLIKLAGVEKIRGRLRLQWLIGGRAYRDTREKDALAAALGRELSCGAAQLPAAVQELKARLKSSEAATVALERRLAAVLARSLLDQAEVLPGGRRLVLGRFEAESPALLQRLLPELLAQAGTAVCLVRAERDQVSWWVAHSPELAVQLPAIVPPCLGLIDGRGGGRGGRWQGSGRKPEGLPAFEQAVAEALRRALRQEDPR